MARSWGNSWGTSWGLSWGATVTPPAPGIPDTGGSGHRRNINDDPDAFAEFFKEHRERVQPKPVPVSVDIGPDPFAELLAQQMALSEAIAARESELALLDIRSRIIEAQRAYEALLDEEDEEILLLM